MLLFDAMKHENADAQTPVISTETESIEQARSEMLDLGCYEIYLTTFDSHLRLGAFLEIVPRLNDRGYWTLLRDVWITAEVTFPKKQDWLNLLGAQRPERESFMSCSEHETLQSLPSVVEIYRGCGHVDGIYGLSWTLSYERAKFFAAYSCGPRRLMLCPEQHGQWPVLAKATCSKSDVIAYLNHRQEEEIVVDPRKITVLGAKEWRLPRHKLRGA